ncbi:30S ribosomal protein 2, chloroplastic [Tanacetum coccineum]
MFCVAEETVVTIVDPTSEAGMWLYAGNIPRTTYNDELQKVFEEHGSIEKVKFIVSVGGLHTLTAHDMCRWDFHQGHHMMIGLGRAAGLLRADTLPIESKSVPALYHDGYSKLRSWTDSSLELYKVWIY